MNETYSLSNHNGADMAATTRETSSSVGGFCGTMAPNSHFDALIFYQ